MAEQRDLLAQYLICLLLIVNLIHKSDGLICYCTEDNCLSKERSNMCIQTQPHLGCFKQLYSYTKDASPITMGCVKNGFQCDSSRIKPPGYGEPYPHTECCFTDHCNQNLTLPRQNFSDNEKGSTDSYIKHLPEVDVKKDSTDSVLTYSSESEIKTTYSSSKDSDIPYFSEARPEYDPSVHPVFLLLIILVIIFLIVVIASILVILKIWFYRRKQSKPRKSWIIQQKMLNSKAQMSHLLTMEPCESTMTSQELSLNIMASGFDVP